MIWLALLALQDAAVEWESDHAAALQKAREFRRPVVIYFRAETCKRSVALEAGAWKSARVAAATRDFVALRVDIDKDEARVRAKYGVRFTPTILFVDREGATLGEHDGSFEADAVAARLEEMGKRHRGPWAPSLDAALARGREAKRIVVLVVWSDATEKGTARANTVLADDAILCLRPFDDDTKKLAEADRTWVIVDPLVEKPLDAPLARIAVAKDAKTEDLVAKVREAREAFARAHPK